MAEYGTYTLSDVASQVKAGDAKFRGWDAAPLAEQAELIRYWTVDHHLQERVLTLLDTYGEGDNVIGKETPVECHAITNPSASDDVQVAGTYRIARNFTDPNEPGKVFQLLRRGWITSLVNNNAVQTGEARLVDISGGNEIPTPTGAGANSFRMRVLKVVWYGVAATSASAVVNELLGLDPVTGWASLTIAGANIGTGWRRLTIESKPAEDGSCVVAAILVQSEGVFEFYSSFGSKDAKNETVVHGVAAELVKDYVEGFRRYGRWSVAGTPPRGGSVGGSVDLDSGLATLRFAWKDNSTAKGAIVTSMYFNANVWQVHFIAWNQPASNLAYIAADMSGLALSENDTQRELARVALGGDAGWFTCNVAIGSVDKAEWSLSGFNYDDETGLFNWHSIWRPVPETFIDDRAIYTSRWEHRQWFWDDPEAGDKYLTWENQVRGTQFKHAWNLFSTFSAALAWRDASQVPDVPMPRQVGMYWLAVKVTVHSCTGWVEAADYDGAVNAAGWHNKAIDLDYQRFIGP
jgi:hypothetical protein